MEIKDFNYIVGDKRNRIKATCSSCAICLKRIRLTKRGWVHNAVLNVNHEAIPKIT